jgi:hypothetical protein
MYSCYPGGLLNHCFKAAKFAVKINELLPENMRTETSSILKCVFLSQVGKTFMFKLNDNEWQRKTLGKMYEFTDSDVSMKAGERSVYYATKFGVTLTEEEILVRPNFYQLGEFVQQRYWQSKKDLEGQQFYDDEMKEIV